MFIIKKSKILPSIQVGLLYIRMNKQQYWGLKHTAPRVFNILIGVDVFSAVASSHFCQYSMLCKASQECSQVPSVNIIHSLILDLRDIQICSLYLHVAGSYDSLKIIILHFNFNNFWVGNSLGSASGFAGCCKSG